MAQTVVIWVQKGKFEREDFRRFMDKRKLYGDFLAAIRRNKARISRAIEENDVTLLPNPHEAEPDTELLAEEIRLIGADATVDAALRVDGMYMVLLLATWKSAIESSGDITIDSEEIGEYEEALRVNEMEFVRIARGELSVMLRESLIRRLSPRSLHR